MDEVDHQSIASHLERELIEARAEIERLRAALRKIADDDFQKEDWADAPGMVWQHVARRALEYEQ